MSIGRRVMNMACLSALVLAGALQARGTDAPPGQPFPIDGFEQEMNSLEGRSGAYQQAPSKVMSARTTEVSHGGARCLKLRYEKKGLGGPFDSGGWCGYWTMLKSPTRYFDARAFSKLVLWVRGQDGGEIFRIGLADANWDKLQDSVKSDDIAQYLPAGRVTTDWQKAEIPLGAWALDFAQLASLAICFESDCYSNGEQSGIVYIDDVQLQ